MTVSEPIRHVERMMSDPPIARAGAPAAAADAPTGRHADGDGAAARPGQRDHAAGPAGCGLRRDGEPRRERPGRLASDQAGPHHFHLSRGGHGRYRRPEGGVSPRGEPCACRRFTRHPTARSSTTRSTPTCSCGWRRASTRAGSTSIACSSASWTSRTPIATTAKAWCSAPRCRCRRRCGRRIGPRSTATGKQQLDKVHIDDSVREYLYPIAVGRSARACRCRRSCAGSRKNSRLLITTGFLPQRFRDEMQFSWDAAKQRRFDRLIAVLRTVNNMLPRFVRRFPFNVLLWDLDRRIKAGRPLV